VAKPAELPRYSLLSAAPWTVVLSLALATADNFAEPDLWIHMLTGETTLRTGHIPRFDTYSYSAAGAPWHNHEWLSQVALAFFYAHLGVFGLKLLKLICSSVLIIALAIGISATGAAARVQRLTLILCAVAISTQMQFRPQLFTFMMIAVVMMALAIEVYRRDATLWPLIPMFALWANFHGGYIVGLGAMGIAAAVMFVQGWIGDASRMQSAWRLALVTLGCAAATILNPFGVGLWMGVAHSVGDPLIRRVIADWVPLATMMLSNWRSSPKELLQYVAPMLMFVGFVAAVALAPDLADAAMLAVAAIFIGAAFYAARNVAVGVIAVAIPLARHASLALARAADLEDGAPADDNEPAGALLAICALALALVGGTFSNRLKTWKPMPTGALAFMQQHQLHGNLLPQFEWGSYVLWHMGDAFKVYIDPRGELVYTDQQEGDYAKFFYGMDGAEKLLDAYPHDYVLMGVHTRGADLVRNDPRWHLLYSDQTAALFGRTALPGEGPVAGNVAGPGGKPADTYFP
jgi:hypothetical protein